MAAPHPAADAALTSESPIPSVEHAPPPVDPWHSGPTELSSKHPNAVNYAISAGGVLLGVAFITTFALICRWRKRRRQQDLDDQIDERIREKSLSRLEANRAHSLPKLPAAAMTSEHSLAHTLPHLGAISTSTNPQRSSNDRHIRSSPPRSRGGAISSRSAARTHSASRPPLRSDDITRPPLDPAAGPPPPSAHYLPYAYDAVMSRPQASSRALGMGIIVAANTAGSLGCPSPTPSTPSLVFSPPGTASSLPGSPAPPEDALATILNPIAEPAIAIGHGPSPALESSLAHMQVSPLVHGGSPSSTSSPPLRGPRAIGVKSARVIVPPPVIQTPAAEGGQGEKWFTEVDWFGADGPLAFVNQGGSSFETSFNGWSRNTSARE